MREGEGIGAQGDGEREGRNPEVPTLENLNNSQICKSQTQIVWDTSFLEAMQGQEVGRAGREETGRDGRQGEGPAVKGRRDGRQGRCGQERERLTRTATEGKGMQGKCIPLAKAEE